MKKSKTVSLICYILAAICFGIVSYGHFYCGRTGYGWIFAALACAQFTLAVSNYIVWKKTK